MLPATNIKYIDGVNESTAIVSLAIERCRKYNRTYVVIAENIHKSIDMYEFSNFIGGDIECYLFPDLGILPYDGVIAQESIVSNRMALLKKIHDSQNKPIVVIISLQTLIRKLPAKSFVIGSGLSLRVGNNIDYNSLSSMGYRKTKNIEDNGDFCIRGEVIDIFPIGHKFALRINLDDETIERISILDVENKKVINKIEEFSLSTKHEFPFDDKSRNIFCNNYVEKFGDVDDIGVLKSAKKGVITPGFDSYLTFFFEELSSFFDYLPQNSVIVGSNNEALKKQIFSATRLVENKYNAQKITNASLLEPKEIILSEIDYFTKAKRFSRISTKENKENPRYDKISNVLGSNISFEYLDKYIKKSKNNILFLADSIGKAQVFLEKVVAKWGVIAKPEIVNAHSDFISKKYKLGIGVASINNGFYDLKSNIIYLPLSGFNNIGAKKTTSNSSFSNSDMALGDLQKGDLLVHYIHGVGKFSGIETDTDEGYAQDFIVLSYAKDQTLYLNMEDMHLLSFYKSAESATKEDVHELGSKRWKGVRAKAWKKIQDTAAELLQMSAVRESKKGLTCDMKAEEYKEFANNFQFKETEDQEQAIEEVISDMQSGKPMERLLCGDVGLGKTEVAMRAAFLAVTNGFQVAVLTPTTLLCEQHYERFLERFNDVECASIGMLSRFYTKKQNDQNYEDLENNKINIIVGTHSLIQNKIKFKNIGLVIIDEEHRFGVKQKESFKKKYPNIHILSMTATPIPRSLNIAMNSVRDMSIMATPPKARLAINTSVIEDIGEKLTSAISREVERGGQVFYLHNDVSTIEHEKIRLEKLLPDCQIGVAHGQMSNIELEDAMIQMYHRKIQVLVCSTIVETGIDIPNVNTIIIQGAHNFGLSQLHQLRGRVGRSHLQAYCYLVTHKKLNKTSQRRIDTIVKYNKLGDGFNIAMQDLEIRGVGDLLGKEQSGNVKSVGFDLYISMLKKAIQLYKDGVLDQEDDIYASRIKSDIHFSLAIPRAYIDEVQDRLLVYKRITNCNSVDEISTIKQELIDKYGAFSLEVDLLFRFHILQIHAKNLDITAIRMNSVSGSIRFKPSDKIIEKMIEILQATGNDKIFSLHPDAKMSFKGDFDDEEKSIFFLEGLINKLL